MNNYALVHKWDTRQQSIADISKENHQDYCSRHDYLLVQDTESYDSTRNGMWMKWLAILRALENPNYSNIDWFFWTDIDVLFMNMTYSLDDIREKANSPNCNFIASRWHIDGSPSFSNLRGDIMPDTSALNWFTIHTGNVFVRNCQWSLDFIRTVYGDQRFINTPAIYNHPTGDEIGFTIYYMGYPEYRNNMGFVPIDYMHSIDPEMRIAEATKELKVYQHGDFIFHAAFIPLEKKVELLSRYKEWVIR